MKASIDLQELGAGELLDYAAHCAWALSRAHARSGDAHAIGT
jgi:hypothetical protein